MKIQRILVDITRLRLQRRPTGIPRVASKYLEHGYSQAATRGVALLPVELWRRGGYFRVHPLPTLVPVMRASSVRKVLLELVRYFLRIGAALLDLMRAVVPFRFLKSLSARAQGLIEPARHRILGERIEPRAGDIVFCPGYWHDTDASVYEGLRARGVDVVLLLHDILPVTRAAFYPSPWRGVFEERLIRSLDFASHFYCVSRQTRSELEAFASAHGKKIRSSVAPNGFEQPAPAVATTGHSALIGRHPWLMVGTIEPKKGHRETIAVFEALWTNGYERPLVMIGGQGWMADAIVELIETSPWSGQHLFWLSAVEDDQLGPMYAGAHALLFASVAEGFGLPLLESASYGTPILARKTAVAREILGDHGTFYDDPAGLSAAILSFEEKENYEHARERISGLAWYDWPTVVEAVVNDMIRPQERRSLADDLLHGKPMQPVSAASPRPQRQQLIPPTVGPDRASRTVGGSE